jgi:GDP-L-fucose synthase
MPCNLYGPNDNFDLETSHVIPALIRKFHLAKINGESRVVVWGSGKPLREFLHVDDLAKGVLFCLDNYDDYEPINCGAGEEFSIREIAEKIQKVVGYKGEISFDSTKPDGAPRKLMHSGKIRELGWKPNINIEEGLSSTYEWFVQQAENS